MTATLQFSANISLMFTEYPFLERFAEAAAAGFKCVEFLFPYEYDPEKIDKELKKSSLSVSVFNLYPGDWGGGDRGLAAVPGRSLEFENSVVQAAEFATTIGAKRLHIMAGVAPKTSENERLFVSNLQHASDVLTDYELEAMIEPINAKDVPGYFLSTTEQALDLLKRIDRENIGLQFDIYHHQITRGDVIASLRSAWPSIRHIQIAGVPDRNEPDYGELSYAAIFKFLRASGYDGWVGCEYHPRVSTIDGLSWMRTIAN